MKARTRFHVECAALALFAGCATERCATFEDLPAGTSYGIGFSGEVESGDLTLPVAPFVASHGAQPVEGTAQVAEASTSSGTVRGLTLRGASLKLPLAGVVDHVQLRFIHMGGRASLMINGFPMPWNGSQSINGSNVQPGGSVFVDSFQYNAPSGQPHNWSGMVTIAGAMQSLFVGGEELWIDHICIRDDDCSEEPVDNALLLSGTPGSDSVQDERRSTIVTRLGRRAFVAGDLVLTGLTAPVGTTVRVEVRVTQIGNQAVSTSAERFVAGTGAAQSVRVPLNHTFVHNLTPAGTGQNTYKLEIAVRSDGAPVDVATVVASRYPLCELSGRFAFTQPLRTLGTSTSSSPADAFHVHIEGHCE